MTSWICWQSSNLKRTINAVKKRGTAPLFTEIATPLLPAPPESRQPSNADPRPTESHMRPPKEKASIHKWMLENHRQLDKAVRERIPKSELKSNTILNRQIDVVFRLPRCPSAFHLGWGSIDEGRRSAACRYEWARLQIFLAAKVQPVLRRLNMPFHLITVANKRWRVSPSEADNSSFDPPRRKVRSAMQKLRDQGYDPIFVAGYELSGDRSLNHAYAFEPHVHILVGGIPKPALLEAFRVRQSSAVRGRDKPLTIKSVVMSELGEVLGYLTKMKAQDRVQYVRSNGKLNRSSNRMPAAEKDHWLRCMATMPIVQTIQFGGFAEPMTNQFIHFEMATIIGDLQ